MRVTIRKFDGHIIEAQSNDKAPLDSLKANLLQDASVKENEFEFKIIPDTDYKLLMEVQTQKEIKARPKSSMQMLEERLRVCEKQLLEMKGGR